MKNLVKEFREFIDKGNVMDLAVAVIIGGAFTAIVKSLTDNIITPLIAFIFGGDGAIQGLVVPGTNIDFGAFISAIINFLIIALIVFLMVKGMNKMRAAGERAVATRDVNGRPVKLVEEAPVCPYCLEEVKPGATRCPHCAGEFSKPAETTTKTVEL